MGRVSSTCSLTCQINVFTFDPLTGFMFEIIAHDNLHIQKF
jgi:hypothetical protein